MFTGRIGELGAIERIKGDVLWVRAPKSADRVRDGGSACVNGVRLTVRPADGILEAALSAETRRRSTFDTLAAGDFVNVETPLQVGDPLDGHLVQGYVDAVGKVIRVDEEGCARRIWLRPPRRLLDRLLAKSPIALEGVSVTIAEVLRDRISVVLLPMTCSATTLGELQAGDRVNLELDLVARLLEKAPASAMGQALPRLPWAGRVDGRAGVEKVLRQLAAGGGVIVWDPETEGEGDVIFAGARLRPESFTFLLTRVCGFPAVPCAPEVLRRLEIAPMPGEGDRQGTAWSIPVDLAAGTGTGVSAIEGSARRTGRAHRSDCRVVHRRRPSSGRCLLRSDEPRRHDGRERRPRSGGAALGNADGGPRRSAGVALTRKASPRTRDGRGLLEDPWAIPLR